MTGAATRLAIVLVGYFLGSPGASCWLSSGYVMTFIVTFIVTLSDHTPAGPSPSRLIGTGPSDRRPFRCSGPALSGHLRRLPAADPRRAGALDPGSCTSRWPRSPPTFASNWARQWGSPPRSWPPSAPASARPPAPSRARPGEAAFWAGHLPLWPPLFDFHVLGSLTTSWPQTTRRTRRTCRGKAPKTWPRTTS